MSKESILKEIYDSSFNDELEKISSTAAGRAVLKGNLSLRGARRVAKMSNKPVHIKHIGQGFFQNTDLVVHQKYGRVTSKRPLTLKGSVGGQYGKGRVPYKRIPKEIRRKRDDEYQALKTLKNISKGKKNVQIAQIKGREGTVHYQQYVKPTKDDKNFAKKVKSVEKKVKSFEKQHKPRRLGLAKREPIKGKPGKFKVAKKKVVRKRSAKTVGLVFTPGEKKVLKTIHEEPKFNASTKKVFKEFSKKYPRNSDFHRLNIVGGKVVDFEHGGKRNPVTPSIKKMRENLINAKGFKKRQIARKNLRKLFDKKRKKHDAEPIIYTN